MVFRLAPQTSLSHNTYKSSVSHFWVKASPTLSSRSPRVLRWSDEMYRIRKIDLQILLTKTKLNILCMKYLKLLHILYKLS